MSARVRRFTPRLEALDDRSLPSVVITTSGTDGATIQITGDDGANNIVITDDGTGTNITIMAEGMIQPWTLADAPGVNSFSALVISTLGGNDTVEYNLSGSLTTSLLVVADLGKGADSFTFNMIGISVSGGTTNLGITANGDGGGDTMTLNANGASVAPEAHMDATFNGKAGRDFIFFNFDPGFLDLGNVVLRKDQKH